MGEVFKKQREEYVRRLGTTRRTHGKESSWTMFALFSGSATVNGQDYKNESLVSCGGNLARRTAITEDLESKTEVVLL